MVLDTQRERIDPLITYFARFFLGIHPNILTWLSLVFALLAGLFFFLSKPSEETVNHYLLIGSLFVFFNGFLDAIDGKVAKLTKKTSAKGDFLDHALDRYADVLMVGGLALSSWCRIEIGFFAMIGMLLTSYMGTQAQAVGYKREYRGLLGRADRLVLLMAFPVLQHFFISMYLPWNLSVLELVLLYFAIVGNLTAIQRFISIMKWFKNCK
ncbi:MAG: CDP-alcohol phosphatidyltransferase family protein [Thermoplasmata archaeon]|nr:MAG: CDP-alcohol phosphatidyltransferase family protein [Thermoplasmata archaeon]HDD57026.1 CDP-alcohol phosphatidyltransferase family protein [Thermoplasmatales archaeon]